MTTTTRAIDEIQDELDAVDQRWRRLRDSRVENREEGHAKRVELAALEAQYQALSVELRQAELARIETMLASLEGSDETAYREAQERYYAERDRFQAIADAHVAGYMRRRDLEADRKRARQALAEAEHLAAVSCGKHADLLEQGPGRGPAPAAMWTGVVVPPKPDAA